MTEIVHLVGEGGAKWQFELPLSEVYADQVKSHALKPADEDSAKAVAHLLAGDEADEQDDTPPESGDDGDAIDSMTGPQLDEFAGRLEVPDWKKNAKVPAKKATLKAFIAAKAAADAEPADVADLTDDELAAKAAELGLEVDPDFDRDSLLAAVRAKLADA